MRTTSSSGVLVAALQYVLAGRPILTPGGGGVAVVPVAALLAPVNRLGDSRSGDRALLDVMARRPA